MARRYPLDPLVGIRREKSDKRALELKQATDKRERERKLAQTAAERRARVQASTDGEKARERVRLEQGELSARDLQQAERFRAGATQKIAELTALEQEAARREKEAALVEARARASLGTAQAEVKAVERHRQGFRNAEARAAEASEEEAAEEHFTVAKRGARGD